jgi:hypothetical protein
VADSTTAWRSGLARWYDPAAMQMRSRNADSMPQAITLLRHCISRVQG